LGLECVFFTKKFAELSTSFNTFGIDAKIKSIFRLKLYEIVVEVNLMDFLAHFQLRNRLLVC